MLHNRINELTEGIRIGVIYLSLTKIVITITYIIQASLMASMLSMMLDFDLKKDIFEVLVMIFLVLMVRALLIYLLSYKEKYYSSKIKTHLRARCIQKIFDIGPAFFNNQRTGKVQSLLVSGIEYLEAYLVRYIPQWIVMAVGSSLIILRIAFLNFKIGLFVLIMLLLSMILPEYWKKILKKSNKEHWNAFSKLNAQYVDSVQGMVTLIAFQADKARADELKKDSRNLFVMTMRNLRNSLVSIGISDIFMTLGSAMTMCIGAYLFTVGELERAALLTLLFLSKEAFRPIEDLKKYYHQGFNGISAADSLFELLDQPSSEDDMDMQMLENTDWKAPEICFENVSFRYSEKEPYVLENVSFRLKSGKKLAIVGESGNGKTTIISLLLRFYTNYEGRILIDGKDLRTIPINESRKLFSLVAQETYLFNETVKDNILLAKDEVAEDELNRAIRNANLTVFIDSLENKENTEIGERGSKVSGGEKQRIAIARAMLKDAPVLLLDEATSSLDHKNEVEIKKNIDMLISEKTCLMIAHRLSTIVDADEIFVLQEGRMIESGTHEKLIAKKGIYFDLFSKQSDEVIL